MESALSVRTATITDVPLLVSLINAAFVVERAFVDRDRTDVDDVTGYLEKGSFLISEGEDGGADACVYVETHGARGYIGMLAVKPGRHGRGIGRRMMSAAEQYCRAAGCRAVDIRIVNLRAELPGFYRSLGYVDTGTAPFNDPKLTKPANFLLMTKDL
jgi:ribosomal protein S18 acetylase RimI-like enzyme